MAHAASFENIHNYDARYDPAALRRFQVESVGKRLTAQSRQLHVQQLFGLLPMTAKVELQMLHMLLIDAAGSMDTVNHVDGQLLFDMCLVEAVRNPEFLKEFRIQLLDLSSGTCPQGRCTRMFQCLYAFGLV